MHHGNDQGKVDEEESVVCNNMANGVIVVLSYYRQHLSSSEVTQFVKVAKITGSVFLRVCIVVR